MKKYNFKYLYCFKNKYLARRVLVEKKTGNKLYIDGDQCTVSNNREIFTVEPVRILLDCFPYIRPMILCKDLTVIGIKNHNAYNLAKQLEIPIV